VHIDTGAVHSGEFSREMVGDWYQRTVSELVRYLSSTNETVTPVLAPPVDTPEYSARGKNADNNSASPKTPKQVPLSPKFKNDYLRRVAHELWDKNCVVVASADVNAFTEILLSTAYQGLSVGEQAPGQEADENTADNIPLPDPDGVFTHNSRAMCHDAVVALKPAASKPLPEEPQRVYSRPSTGGGSEQLGPDNRDSRLVPRTPRRFSEPSTSGKSKGWDRLTSTPGSSILMNLPS
jgi:hypothetical protein